MAVTVSMPRLLVVVWLPRLLACGVEEKEEEVVVGMGEEVRCIVEDGWSVPDSWPRPEGMCEDKLMRPLWSSRCCSDSSFSRSRLLSSNCCRCCRRYSNSSSRNVRS